MIQQPELGKKIADLRKAKGMTQEELVGKCNLNVRTLQRIESGEVMPRTYTVRLIFEALEVSFDKSLHNKGLMQKWPGQFYINFIDLFNLKTHTMKKITILTVIFGLIGFGLFTFTNKSYAQPDLKLIDLGITDPVSEISKSEAIKEIKEINRKAKFHNQAIEVILFYAEKSSCNFDTYVLISKLAGSFGYSTKPLLEIANTVFLTYSDCNLFNDIAPLIFLNGGVHTYTFVNLAKKASDAKSEDAKNKIQEEIIKYREEAKYKNLSEAFNNQKNI